MMKLKFANMEQNAMMDPKSAKMEARWGKMGQDGAKM